MKKKNKGYCSISSMAEIERGFKLLFPKSLSLNDVFFVCIGTDRSTGDSLGPLVGTFLEAKGYDNVIGTIDMPVHAVNLEERLKEIPVNKTVIAIDAALGSSESVGTISVQKGSLKPGEGVQRELSPVGDYSIKGIVNTSGWMEYFVLQNTRLKVVMDLCHLIASGIEHHFPLERGEINGKTKNSPVEAISL